jgi:hypothetical protein
MNFYKHFIGDYARDTGHLAIVEHGVFRLMLDNFYATGKPLPSDKKALYRLLRADTESEKKAVDKISSQFFVQLPATLEDLYSRLGFHAKDEWDLLRQVMPDGLFVTGGLINFRALREIIKAQAIANKNRQIAIDREQRKRTKSSVDMLLRRSTETEEQF